MVSLRKSAQFIAVLSSITISILFNSNVSHAKDFKIGEVKESFQMGGLCLALLPNTRLSQQKYMLVIPFTNNSEPVFAWINIDKKDIRLRQISNKIDKSKMRSIAKYKSRDILMTINSRQVQEKQGGISETITMERIVIERAGQTKIINTTGRCVI